MKFTTKELENFTLIHFELENPIKPDDLKHLNVPKVNPRKGVVVSGRGPIWLHCFLAHKYHHTPFVAVYDPRLGAVVVQSHTDLKEGDVIDVVVEEVLE
jgi:CRISPR-associated protein Csx3